MLNMNLFISQYVTKRPQSMFLTDIQHHEDELRSRIEGKTVCVIGGAGSIGSSFIKALLPFRPDSLVVVDINENALAELTRDLRSSDDMYIPEDYITYPMDRFRPASFPVFRRDSRFRLKRCETLFCFARGIRADLFDELYSGE